MKPKTKAEGAGSSEGINQWMPPAPRSREADDREMVARGRDTMRTHIGDTNLISCQGWFPRSTDCVHCGARARMAFTAVERGRAYPLICDLHENQLADKGPYWLHDVAAFAIYLCTKCTEATCLYNQA